MTVTMTASRFRIIVILVIAMMAMIVPTAIIIVKNLKKRRNTRKISQSLTSLNGEIKTYPTSCMSPHLCLNPFLLTPKHSAVAVSQGQMNRRKGSSTERAGHKCLQRKIRREEWE